MKLYIPAANVCLRFGEAATDIFFALVSSFAVANSRPLGNQSDVWWWMNSPENIFVVLYLRQQPFKLSDRHSEVLAKFRQVRFELLDCLVQLNHRLELF